MLNFACRFTLPALGAIALAVSCACGATSTHSGGGTIDLGQADAGRTVQVKVGDTVRVTLEDDFPVPGSSLVWNVTSGNEAALAPGVTARSSPVPSGPGRHQTYTAEFHAMTAGQAVLDVHGTTSCEAMAKQNCPDRDFNITIVISA